MNKNQNLHLIASPLTAAEFETKLARNCLSDGPLLFIGASVTSLTSIELNSILANLKQPVLALKADVLSRGISNFITSSIELCDDNQMVNLTLKCHKVISW